MKAAYDQLGITEVTKLRDLFKLELDAAQSALNSKLIAGSPVQVGDVLRGPSGNLWRVSSVSVKTLHGLDGTLSDKLIFAFQKKRKGGWEKVGFTVNEMNEAVLTGRAVVIRRGNDNKE